MKVVWTVQAERDRADICHHLVTRDPRAAVRMDELFGQAAARLARFPLIGREGVVLGTRETKPHRNYRLVYQIVNDTVWILALVHAARQWPPA